MENVPQSVESVDEHEAHDGDTLQFITFRVGEEEYGVNIMSVREIKGWSETTRLPNAPEYMKGVINLRGVIVPIFDLRLRFSMGETEVTKTHVVVIVSMDGRDIGILVDAVSDILTIFDKDIQPIPDIDDSMHAEFLQGLVTVETRMVSLLSLEKLFDLGNLPNLNSTGSEG